MGDNAKAFVIKLVNDLRQEGVSASCDNMKKSLKAQMKYADKLNASFSMVIGDNEIENNSARLKNMKTGEQTEIAFDEKFNETFSNIAISEMFSDVMDDIKL